jgi:2-dehydropantoate 2-reductase
MILPVLNGMKHMDSLAARFGAQTVVGCACKIAAFVDDAGRIVQLARFQELVYGEMDGTATPRMQHLDETLQGAGFTARLSATVAQEMWEKWTLLATMGGICCLMRGNTGEIASVPGGAEFSTHFLDEVVRIVSAVGVAPREAFVSSTRTALADKTSQQNTSMYRDLTQGRPVEAEQIIGDLLARGQAAGIAAPLLAAAFAHLSVYQARLAA